MTDELERVAMAKCGRLLLAAVACASAACFADPVFEVAHETTFDPAKAGWKLVFADEFDGTELDAGKWYRPHFARKQRMDIAPDGNGHLVFKVKRNEKGRFPNTYLYSIPEYTYGYFEARVKFTKGLGWWAASWVHGASKENPFLDGIEVDTFEDFFTRLVDGHPLRDRMAHSLHTKIGSHGVSQQVTTSVEPPVDGWHTIACKWRPLAFEFYLDGRLTGSYTAFNNAACIRPLHAVLSVEDMQGKKWLQNAGREGAEDGEYIVDYVRIWKDPEEEKVPQIVWKDVDCQRVFTPTGKVENFMVVAKSPVEDDPITETYLFDNGFMVGSSLTRPYKFEVPFVAETFTNASYGRFRCTRNGKWPPFDAYPHVFVAFARTQSGRVGHSAPIFRIVADTPSPAPFEGKAASIPGSVEVWRFDAGGPEVSYHRLPGKKFSQKGARVRETEQLDCSKGSLGVTYAGEWVNYTVDVAKSGTYQANLRYGAPMRSENCVDLLVDGRYATSFTLTANDNFAWAPSQTSSARLELEAGRHVLTVLFRSQLMFGGLDFIAQP
ncbi:MAG: family 16 glycosylhydrolase [Kiritimatiellae bacterium]|nr:family 16 glycosylhydrolase [Kiritimatiellia bacterium]